MMDWRWSWERQVFLHMRVTNLRTDLTSTSQLSMLYAGSVGHAGVSNQARGTKRVRADVPVE
jgi:hypothetical protein